MRTSRIKDTLPADINVSKYVVEIVGFGSELGGWGVALLHFVFCCISEVKTKLKAKKNLNESLYCFEIRCRDFLWSKSNNRGRLNPQGLGSDDF